MASDDFQPRLFFLDHSSILTIKRWMPQYRDKWDNSDVEFNNSFSLEDVETLKEALRVFGDESKVLFVFRPFTDLTYNHGYFLISDRTVEGKLKLIHKATHSYAFGIFPNLNVRITEEKLAPSMGSSYFIGARQMCQLLMNVAPWSPILTETCETAQKGEREWNLTAIYGAETRELTPLPQLFQNRGWNFQHFGYCSTLEPIEDGFHNIQPFVRRNARTLRIKLENGYSVQLFRLVDLNFLNQFRRLSPSVENVSEMGTDSNFAEEENWETGPIPIPRKIKQLSQEQFALSAQLQMSSALEGKSTRAIIPQFQNAEVPPPTQPGLIPQVDIPSTPVIAQSENAIELPTSAVVSEKKNPKELSSKNFSISFEVGGETMTVGRKRKDNLTEEFVQNVLQSLENGYQSSESKTEVPLRNQNTEKTGFDQQLDEIQLLTDQIAPKITTTINQIGEKQSGKVITTLAQYKNKLTPNLTKPETESNNAATAPTENAEKTLKMQEKRNPQSVESTQQENAAKTLEIQDSTIKVRSTALKGNTLSTLKVQEKLAAAKKSRKPTTVYKIITLEDFQNMKASQAINKSSVERLKSNPQKFFSIGKKKEQVFENRNSKKSSDKLQSSQKCSEVKKEMDVDRSDNLPEKLVSVPVQTPNPNSTNNQGVVNWDQQKSPGAMSPQTLQQQMQQQQPLIETNQATLALHAIAIPPNIPPPPLPSTSPSPADHQGFGQQSPVYPAHQQQKQQQQSRSPANNSSSKSSTINGNGGIRNNVSLGACTSSKLHQLTRGINNSPHGQQQVQPQMSQSIPPPPQKTNLNKDDQGGCGYSELRPSATTASASDEEELDYEKYCRDMALAQRQLQQSSAAPAKSSGGSSKSKSLKSSCSSTPVQNNNNLMPAGSPNPNPKDDNDDAPPGAKGIREEREVAAPKLRRSDRIGIRITTEGGYLLRERNVF